MKFIQELGILKPNLLIFTGDGSYERIILRELCEKYNGAEIILWFPALPGIRKSGLSALNYLKDYPNKSRINTLIYIVDGEFFENNAKSKIIKYLGDIGVRVVNTTSIQKAFLLECEFDPIKIKLYCIISGPEIFIEEEIAKLIELKLNVKIELSGKKDREGRKRIKSEIKRILRNQNKKIDKLIRETGIKNLEIAFPNICAVLKEIEKNFPL